MMIEYLEAIIFGVQLPVTHKSFLVNKGFIIVSQRLTHGVSTKTNNLGEGSWAIGQLRPIIQLNNIVINKRHHLTEACA